MLVLGIETSCDDTAAAVVEDGGIVRSSVVSSQDSIHGRYGGIVPELASRRHIEAIIPVVEEALTAAGAGLKDIDGIAVTQGPGLVGSILVGLTFAKAVSLVTGIPFTGVNHIAAHPIAAFLKDTGNDAPSPCFPFVSLIASGGHTALLLIKDFNVYEVLGQTRDDAAGEAFDKVAKLLGLGYPGGTVIDALSKTGDPKSFPFTRPYIAKGSLDFSFSGIKTAAMNHVKTGVEKDDLNGFAASFQEAVVDVLVTKALWAVDASGAKDLVVAGGVACNSRLRERLIDAVDGAHIRLFIPHPRYCSDNAAMIAALGYAQLKKGSYGNLTMNAVPSATFRRGVFCE
ncbi:MAG: tRNA (adenosine(37)-N6)-threonylcarbamoyltransferase complex transferase subunit TsaD [Deltaproteobacteria bacterium]|nr:tRNA (adenosine(37)-N6)-threonylcarbamoyltransferase complex transferase subunit TsaD [Deltaproteobacteria bacterium]